MFVGRSRELGLLDERLDAAQSGRGGLCVVSGEAGIGKTRFADEVVARADARGFRTSWGRAWETGGAPAYWPWVELLGPLVEVASDAPTRVQSLLEPATSQDVGEGTRADPARERFELFESVSSFCRGCARQTPLLLVFDDLHAADGASLELLSFVARGLRTARIVALCTQRGVEARQSSAADVLARIAREGDTVVLRPLNRDDVAAIVRHELGSSDAALEAAVSDLTEGNPLFVREAAHAVTLHKSGTSFDALRQVASLGGVLALARTRLARAPEATRDILQAASVLGRELPLDLVAAALGRAPGEVRGALEDGTACGLLVQRDEARWAFSHVLVREALYHELPAEARRTIHHALAVELQKRIDARLAGAHRAPGDASFATLAHHAAMALPLGEPGAAVQAARRAAIHARAQLAYEEAIALLERALGSCDAHGVDDHERAEVLLALGWAATEAGKLERGREAFRGAAALARKLGDSSLLARAALGQGGEYVLAEIRSELLDVLREALAALEGKDGDEPRRLRARLLARLGAALTPSVTPEEPLALARQALAMAEGETDARTRIDVDLGVGATLVDFAPPAERIEVNERLLQDARQVSDRVLELRALTRLGCDYLEQGDVARSEAVIARRAALAESIGQPRYLWQTPLLRSMQAMPRGAFGECESYVAEARRCATAARDPNAERCIEFHRFTMLAVAGRTDALRRQRATTERTLLTLFGNPDLRAWIGIVAASRLGDRATTAKLLRELPWPSNAATMERVTLLEAAALAGERELCARLFALIDHESDTNTCWGPFAFVCGPPIARTLALAEFALGRPDAGVGQCKRALALATRTHADAHLAWVHLAWAEGMGDHAQADRALELGECLDMPEVVARARTVLAKHARDAAPVRGDTPEAATLDTPAFRMFRDDAKSSWTVEHGGRSFRLKDVRGLGMLARLVAEPGRELHALDLASDASGDERGGRTIDLGDAGAVLDPRARGEYKARIEALREELEEAEQFADTARAERIRDELDALGRQLAAAVGLGGRERRQGSAAERARTVVQRRVREAIKKIAGEDAELGRHLDWAVRTGMYCAYEPEGRKTAR